MNYEPNIIDWKVGDLVVHDADAKAPYMLMRVVKIQKDGLVVTRYAHPKMIKLQGSHSLKLDNTRYKNDKKFLLNPKDFGIESSEEGKE